MLIKNNLSFLLLFCILSQNVLAGSLKTGNPERKKTNSEAFTEQIYKKFEKLQEMIADELYVEARTGLNELLDKRVNGFENAMINQYIGWIDQYEGKYAQAAKRFQSALDADALPNQAHFGMMLQMAQLYTSSEENQKALDMLKKYYATVDEIEDKTFAMEANIYYQMNDYKKAIPVMKKAIELSEKPQERWNYLLFGALREESKFKEAGEVMETLIQINPDKKDYWSLLSQNHFRLKEDSKSLAVLAVANENGLVNTEKEILQLYQMYAFMENPYSAGKTLEKGLKDGVIKPTFKRWEDLGKTWYQAAEMDKALIAYTEASKLATDGKIDLYRAYIYLDKEDWPKIVSTTNAAIEKEGLSDKEVGKAWMLLGTAEYEMKNFNNAIVAFKKATKYEDTKRGAYQWLEHLQERAAHLQEKARIEKANDREREANAIIDQ